MDYVVCRCEDVMASAIQDAIMQGANNGQEVKFRTRAGMGFCQGRTCRPLVEDLLDENGLQGLVGASMLTVHLPVRPTALTDLTNEEALNG